jgi:P27 family predicted phage terminase small subunit
MPTPVKRSGNIRKHLTNAEKAARNRAEGALSRQGRVSLRVPKWLDAEARAIFMETKRRLKGLELLDNADAELLGIYCDAVAKYRAASRLVTKVDKDGKPIEDSQAADKDTIAGCQSWARLVAGYAEKLGLTPNARARLAKKKAEADPVDELEMMLDDVTEYVNAGGGK